MKCALRVISLGLLAVLAAVAWTWPDLLEHCGLDLAAGARCREEQARARQRDEAVARRYAVSLQRTHAKQAIIDDLIAGRLTLVEAARRFILVNETPVICQDDYRAIYPGRSDGEKACRQVLSWVESPLKDISPGRAEEIRRRLTDELRRHLECNNGLVVFAKPDASE